MSMNDLVNVGQSDSCSFVVFASMKPLEDSETGSFAYRISNPTPLSFTKYSKPSSFVFPPISMIDGLFFMEYFKALESKLSQTCLIRAWIRFARRQIADANLHLASIPSGLDLVETLLNQFLCLNSLPLNRLSSESRELQ